jgi:hypothetical protein
MCHTYGRTEEGTILSIGVVRDEEDRNVTDVMLSRMSGDCAIEYDECLLTKADIQRLRHLLRETKPEIGELVSRESLSEAVLSFIKLSRLVNADYVKVYNDPARGIVCLTCFYDFEQIPEPQFKLDYRGCGGICPATYFIANGEIREVKWISKD